MGSSTIGNAICFIMVATIVQRPRRVLGCVKVAEVVDKHVIGRGRITYSVHIYVYIYPPFRGVPQIFCKRDIL